MLTTHQCNPSSLTIIINPFLFAPLPFILIRKALFIWASGAGLCPPQVQMDPGGTITASSTQVMEHWRWAAADTTPYGDGRSPFHGVSLGTKGRTRMVGFGPIVLDFWWRSMSISWDIMNNERQCPEFSYCISISGGFTGHYWYLFLDSYSKKETEDESLVWINLRRRSARSPSGHV